MPKKRIISEFVNRSHLYIISLILFWTACQRSHPSFRTLAEMLQNTPFIEGKQEYLQSPYVTAGDRVYMVGHQDGSFPDLGWHIQGEMGGIWNHPIKLMDGFDAEILLGDQVYKLNNASAFTNFPFCNRHDFHIEEQNIQVERWQFVPDQKEGLVVQFVIKNQSNQVKDLRFEFTGHSDLRPTWLSERLDERDYPDLSRFHEGLNAWITTDSLNPWSVIYGSLGEAQETNQEINNIMGQGTSASMSYDMSISGNQASIITMVIAGSYQSEELARHNFEDIRKNYATYFKQKKARYEHLAYQSKLTIPDKQMQKTFEWLKYNCDWLVRTVPEIGTGIGAGIPDYP